MSQTFAWLLFASAVAHAAPRQITCPNGEKRFEIEVSDLAIRYEGSSLSASLAGLEVFAPRLTIDPKPLQQAAAATQQWNELLKGLAEGWNKCILTAEDYKQGVDRIYPRLKEEAADFEKIRQEIRKGKQVNERQLRDALERFNAGLRGLARMGDREYILDRIAAIVGEKVGEGTDRVLARLDELERRLTAQPLVSPDGVRSELNRRLHEKAELAYREYRLGYESYGGSPLKPPANSIFHFEIALKAVPLPEFYSALSSAYLRANRLTDAERIAREGLEISERELSDEIRANLEAILGFGLARQGKYEDGVEHLRWSLHFTEKLYGPGGFRVALALSGLAGAYSMKGDWATSINLRQRALEIYEAGSDEEKALAVGEDHMLLMAYRIIADFRASIVYSRCAFRLSEENEGLGFDSGYFAYETARSQRQLGDLAGAVFTLQEALSSMRSKNSPDLTALLESELGSTYLQVGDIVEAVRALERAQSIYITLYGLQDGYALAVARDLEVARKRTREIQLSF
ncbi:MAG TPA: tetratricopeptide repeat protein [Thermoanaerobaculia bacterium]|nr:tetratricopeptide repeat protein [Thermoanaerobaculia bacterium]